MTPAALSLTSLAVEYCKAVAGAPTSEPRDFLRDMLRYLPRIYITVSDINPYGDGADNEPQETGAIYDTVRTDMSTLLGPNDVYLDTPVEQMQFSDTPVAVSLAEQLADVYQAMADFAATMAQITDDMVPDTLSELRYRFASYLADTICRALKAANYVYYNADFEG